MGRRRQPDVGHRRRSRARDPAGASVGGGAGAGDRSSRRVRRVGSRSMDTLERHRHHDGRRDHGRRRRPAGRHRPGRSIVRRIDRDRDLLAARRQSPPRHPHRRRLARATSTCCRWCSRSTCAPTPPRATCSSGASGARPTRRPRGMRPSSRCAPTASSTSPNPTSAWRSSTTGATGTACSTGRSAVSLLRAARYPDPDADQGRHVVDLALYPHGAGLADVVREAERFNTPVRAVRGSAAADRRAGRVAHRHRASRSTPSSSPTTAGVMVATISSCASTRRAAIGVT